MLKYYFHVDPTALTDQEWALNWEQLQFALKFDGDRYGDMGKLSASPKRKFK